MVTYAFVFKNPTAMKCSGIEKSTNEEGLR